MTEADVSRDDRLDLEIAGVRVVVDGTPREWLSAPALARFRTSADPGKSRVAIAVGREGERPSDPFPFPAAPGRSDTLADAGDLWLRRVDWLGRAAGDRSEWRFWIDRAVPRNEGFVGRPWLLLALWGHLAGRGGAYLHGSLCVLDGLYVLFLGDSGVGKSTLSTLVLEAGGACLTDENPFVTRDADGRPRAHATPWPGPRGPEVPLSGALDAVFFLRHAPADEARELSGAEAGRRLLANARYFHWDPATIPATVETLDGITLEVPAFDLGFVPRPSAVETVRSALRGL